MKAPDQAPDPASQEISYRPHLDSRRPYLRDMILGVNDGLVSIFLLIAGLVGGQLSSSGILLGGVVGALAGAVSMALGEYLATKSQNEVWQAELELEEEHIRFFRDRETRQLYDLLGQFGIDGDDLTEAVRIFSATDERLMKANAILEFGVVESERRSPFRAGWTSGAMFLIGALLPLAPFLLSLDPGTGLAWSFALTFAGLFAVGWGKTRITAYSGLWSGLENMLIAGAGAVIAWWVGRLLDIGLS